MAGEPGSVRALVRDRPYDVAALGLALVAGVSVLVIGHEVFPFLSRNHDEGVYLQQAAMLLDGQLFLTPGSEALREAFRPWFFIESPRGLYPKYSPVPAAMFALGKLAGGYRLALAGVAAANIWLGYLFAAAAFDRRTGLLAAGTFLGAPLFLINSATFLPYAPTTALNLLFAVGYVRSVRRNDRQYAALAGAAIGLAFFARPYTALLFALPFVAHALWRTTRAVPEDRRTVARTAIMALVGLLFVGLTLGYNAVTTGAFFRFPYQAFAPFDGIGFGRRALLEYERFYTIDLALRANGAVLWTLVTDWFTAGLIGSAFAAVGLLAVGARQLRGRPDPITSSDVPYLRVLMAGVIATVVLGNVAFWGNLNILGRLGDPNDGFISVLGPFYHFDLLLPLAAFAAHGAVVSGAMARAAISKRLSPGTTRLTSILLIVVALSVASVSGTAALAEPIDRNAEQTDRLRQAYAPFETTDLDGALVFLPPTYGDWRNHPFQWLRNDPGFDGPTVYALARNPSDDFAVIDAYPGRSLYRYRYHGVWAPDQRVTPVLERVRLVGGQSVVARTTVSVPERIIDLRVSLRDGDRVRRYDYTGELPRRVAVDWELGAAGATIDHPALSPADGDAQPIPIDGPSEVVLTVTITEPGGGTLTYREEVLVRPTQAGVQALWPPASSTCTLVTDCGLEGTYLPDRPDSRPMGIEMNTTLVSARQG